MFKILIQNSIQNFKENHTQEKESASVANGF